MIPHGELPLKQLLRSTHGIILHMQMSLIDSNNNKFN